MNKEKREIWDKKYNIKRGFKDEEIKEFDYLMIMGRDYETLNDIGYQKRLYDFIVSIINNENLDYISKLDKLKCFIDTNKSLELYSRERWKF